MPAMLASAATITVNTDIDEYGGSGSCSLRDAIEAANTDTAFGGCPAGTGNDTVSIPAGFYQLDEDPTTNEDLNVDGDIDLADADGVTIQGAGSASTIVDGDGSYMEERVFDVLDGDATFADLTVRNGNEPEGSGGGIFAGGDGNLVTVLRSSVHFNTADFLGGGIASGEGTELVVVDSLIANNQATGQDGDGGGIHADWHLTVRNTTVADNHAEDFGGGIKAFEGITLEGSTVSGNSTVNGEGGGVWLEPIGTIERLQQGEMQQAEDVIIDTTISDNVTQQEGGGLWIDNDSGAIVEIYDSTFSNNRALDGGGIYNDLQAPPLNGGATYLENVTISSNIASDQGGGIFNDGHLSANHTTIYRNVANSDGGAGGIFDDTPEPAPPRTTEYQNTIIAGNTPSDCAHTWTTGTPFVSQGNNVLGDGTCDDSGPDDISPGTDSGSNVDPRLGPLADNGGPTETHEVLAESPAIDAAESGDSCPEFDQRGVERPTGAGCEIGAYEVGSLPVDEGPGPDVGGVTVDRKLFCRKMAPTILGTSAAEKLIGTPGADVIQGREGSDVILGKGGDDVICGALGKDLLKGQGGDDWTKGLRGDDTDRGGPGTDKCVRGPGEDRYFSCENIPQAKQG